MIQVLFNSTTNRLEIHDTDTGEEIVVTGFVNGKISGTDEVAHCCVPQDSKVLEITKMLVNSLR